LIFHMHRVAKAAAVLLAGLFISSQAFAQQTATIAKLKDMEGNVLVSQGIMIDRERHRVTIEERPLDLTPSEFGLLESLIRQPGLLLADEPTGALDAATGRALMDLLLELNAELHTALVVVTHDEAIARRCGRIIKIEAGRLVA